MASEYTFFPSDEEIDELYNIAATHISHDNYTRFPGSTYEEGVRDCIEYLLGEVEEPPLCEGTY